MSKFGRNDQAVTANSSTTIETSNGAPIGTWNLVKGDKVHRVNAANAHYGNTSPGSRANTDAAMFNNATPGAFISGMAVGVFGVSATEMQNNVSNSSKERPAHAGWVVRRAGTGPVTGGSVTVNSGQFMNNETITVSNTGINASNASLVITTNNTGNIVSLVVGNPGGGFSNVASLSYTFNHDATVLSTVAAGSGGKYVASVTTAGGTGYNNTDVLHMSNGLVNATATISTNTIGGFTGGSATISANGLFVNTTTAGMLVLSVTNSTGGTPTGNANVSVFTPVLASYVASGFNNTDFIVVSGGFANARVNMSTNTTGGFTGGTLTVNVAGNFGLNAYALSFAVVNSTGGTTTAGNNVAYTFSDTLANSSVTATVVATLGGRAGRVFTETLVAMGSLGSQTSVSGTPALVSDSVNDNTYYPGT